MPSRYDLKDVEKAVEEMRGESDRAAIIVGAATVDTILQILIERTLPPLPSGEMKRAFSEHGLLGDFAAKVFWLYSMRLIGPQTRHDLDMIRRIRNDAAHDPNPTAFSDSTIKTRALTIEVSRGDSEPDNARERYINAVALLSLAVSYCFHDGVEAKVRYPKSVGPCVDHSMGYWRRPVGLHTTHCVTYGKYTIAS